jgi:arylformamidase
VVSLRPRTRRAPDGRTDQVITLEQLRQVVNERPAKRWSSAHCPTTRAKVQRDWSGSNPAYLQSTACAWLRSIGVKHLLLDLPSVDREEDGGVLAAHHAFWDFPGHVGPASAPSPKCSQVPAEVRDGRIPMLELQLPHFMNDAAPSRPVLYAFLP